MNVEDIVKLEKKKSNLEEFLNFAFDQPIPYQFRPLSYIPVDFSKINNEVNLYQCEDKNLYFIIEYKNVSVLIYKIDIEKNIISEVKCTDKIKYQDLIKLFADNIQLSKISN